MKKYFLIICLFIFITFVVIPVYAQVPSPNCLGSCPTLNPWIPSSATPSATPSTVPSAPSNAPSIVPSTIIPSQIVSITTPTPSVITPCNSHHNYYRSWGKKRSWRRRGFIQQGTSYLFQFIIQFLQKLGIQVPGFTQCPAGGGSTTPIVGITPNVSPAIPSNIPSSAPSVTLT